MIINKEKNTKSIKTFVKRQGRISKSSKFALENYKTKYVIDINENKTINNLSNYFKNSENKLILEIGFGMGHSLIEMAKNNKNFNYLGIEVHTNGVASILKEINSYNLDNIKVIQFDALEIIENVIIDNSISGVQIYFPDPWHKSKHHKRRLLNEKFLKILKNKLKPNSFIHFVTDWEDYAKESLKILENIDWLKNNFKNYAPYQYNNRPITKFETRGLKLNHKIYELFYQKAEKNH